MYIIPKKYCQRNKVNLYVKKTKEVQMKDLQKLAELAGISSSYIDKTGKKHETTDDVRLFFLKSMGISAESEAEIKASISKLEHKPILPVTIAFYDNEEIQIPFNGEGKYNFVLKDEQQKTVWSATIEDEEQIIIKSQLSHGYYLLSAEQNQQIKAECFIIYAPVLCYQPQYIKNQEHLYGVSLMLYALRSKNSLGIGDFGDLAEIIKITAQNGGDVVGVNPLGVMSPYTLPSPIFNILKGDVSPYRSLSRLFINYVYLDLKSEPDYQNAPEVQTIIKNPEVINEINRLNSSNNVLYSAALQIKLQILGAMYNYFVRNPAPTRLKAFNEYKKEKGEELENLCLFETLLESHRGEHFWRFWRDGTDNAKSQATAAFREHNQKRIDFFAYCHWLADKQIKSVQALAKSLDMKIGLYADMPIGAASNGAEVWENTEAYVLETGIGAPADPMRPRGQSWGFTPYHPIKLKKQHYAPFIKLVKENMTYAGALRIDHAMGLRRLFWGFFTPDNPVVQGCYIYYDMKELTAILAIESNRAKCLVIGEDLGTVPEGFREYMAEHGLLSYKVFFRQKEKDGTFIAPKDYMYMSLAQSSTHDQATSCGFWNNEDIEVFKQCGLYVNYEQYQNNLSTRRKDRENMIKAFKKENLLTPQMQKAMEESAETGETIPQGIENPVNIYGAKTNSALYLVRLCDIYAQKKLDNAPGTIDEYANWRLKLSHSIEDIKATSTFAEAMKAIKQNRP